MDNSIALVKGRWEQLTAFSKKEDLKTNFWNEIAESYSAKERYYHNIDHIARLFGLLEKHLDLVTQPAVVAFAIIYHDLVYNTSHADNEEQSAARAKEQLQLLNVKGHVVENVQQFILATKTHKISDDYLLKDDLALFLDFDLSILGSELEVYEAYRQNIRQEFIQYREPVYKTGRTEALKKLLTKPYLFNTEIFRTAYEQQARMNLEHELSLL
jgi:predicted metal-dependent HD superfamily phosphohydrolase